MKSYSQLTRTWLPLMVLVALTSNALAQPKIGLIDLKKTFDSYWMTKQQNAELKESEAEYEKSRRRLLDDYQRAGDEYKKLLEGANDQALSADERAKRKSDAERKVLEIREIEQSITTFDRTARQTLEDQTRRIRDRILVKIREVIDTQARSGGYTMVLDTAAVTVNQTPMILYHNGQNDLTDTVLAELNATAPISLPTPTTPAPAPAPAIKRP
jgi:Skp family chaperone for outer membrane proteins